MTMAPQPVERLAELASRWSAMRDFDPNDRSARENLAAVQLELFADDHPVGSIARSQQLLLLLAEGFPIPKLEAAYFENLDLLLKPRTRLPSQLCLCARGRGSRGPEAGRADSGKASRAAFPGERTAATVMGGAFC